MDVHTLSILNWAFFWAALGICIFQLAFYAPGRGRQPRWADAVQIPLIIALTFVAITNFALGNYVGGAVYGWFAFTEFWHWWNKDDTKRRRRKWKAALKRRVAVVAGRTKVVEA